MREISLDRLRTLVAIADLGSFAEAARALHLHHPPSVCISPTWRRAWAASCCRAPAGAFSLQR